MKKGRVDERENKITSQPQSCFIDVRVDAWIKV
jgi:hypothetical protein